MKQANELLQRFEKDLSKLESSVDYGSDYSVYTGTTGVVVLYWLLANVHVEENVCNLENSEAKRFMEKKLEKQRVCQQLNFVAMWSVTMWFSFAGSTFTNRNNFTEIKTQTNVIPSWRFGSFSYGYNYVSQS